jgi:teichuronic acid biosynthesis glycosyltransferase TuaG|tara:strand:+ start:9021 stop:9944 length:924 start_codon:yes stop_codon:yes gene_type:complete
MKKILFSIIITSHNARHYIDKTIRSVTKQNFKNYEIILVDDCSNDGTIDLVKKNYNNQIKIFTTKTNFGGPAKSRNIGINESNGSWISFLDADDFWFQNRLSFFNKLIFYNPGFEVFCSNEILINKINKRKKVINHGPFSVNFFEDLLIKGNRLSPSASLVKKDFLVKNNITFDTNQNLIGVEDYDFWLNLSKNKAKFFFTPTILNAYVIHDQNITNNSKKHLENTLHVIEKNFQYYDDSKKKKYLERVFNVKYSFSINHLFKKENFFQNFIQFLTHSTKNPILSTKFILKKLNEKIYFKKPILNIW